MYIYIYIYIYPHTRVSFFPGLISVTRVNVNYTIKVNYTINRIHEITHQTLSTRIKKPLP